MNILIIEDDINLAKVLAYDLKEKYDVKIINSGINIEEELKVKYDLILLDWMLPDIAGIDLIEIIKKKSQAKIIMLTAKIEEAHIVEAFNRGIDDYVTKPFMPLAFMARINAHLKNEIINQEFTYFNDLKINLTNYEVFYNDEKIKLSKTEFKLLIYFIENHDQVLKRDKILNKIWGYDNEVETRVVDVNIAKLREKVFFNNELETVHGIGYRLLKKH